MVTSILGRDEETVPSQQIDFRSRRDSGTRPGSRGATGDGRALPEPVPEAGQPPARVVHLERGQEVGEGHRQEEQTLETGLRQVDRRHLEVNKTTLKNLLSNVALQLS